MAPSLGLLVHTPVPGSSIVNQDRRIVGIGYNGFPMGCSDDELPWARQAENELDTKYPVSTAHKQLYVTLADRSHGTSWTTFSYHP